MLIWTVSDPANRISIEISAKSLVFILPYCYTGGLVLTACLDGGTLYAREGSRTHVPFEATEIACRMSTGSKCGAQHTVWRYPSLQLTVLLAGAMRVVGVSLVSKCGALRRPVSGGDVEQSDNCASAVPSGFLWHVVALFRLRRLWDVAQFADFT